MAFMSAKPCTLFSANVARKSVINGPPSPFTRTMGTSLRQGSAERLASSIASRLIPTQATSGIVMREAR